MGDTQSKNINGGNYYSEKEVMNLKEKVKLLQEEIKVMMGEREKERRRKYERKKLKEEVMQLKKMVEEKDEKMKEMKEMGLLNCSCPTVSEELVIRSALMDTLVKTKKKCSSCGCSGSELCDCVAVNAVGDSGKEWEVMGTKMLFEIMKEERARRDEAVEKWKQLYLAIKTELDDLIQRTYDGEGLYCKAEENDGHMEILKRELQDKEGVIETLKAQLESMEQEKIKREREFDLLKQSLRIINGKNKSTIQTKEKLRKSKHGR